MPVLSVSYDLFKEPSCAYGNVIKAIKTPGSWCRVGESHWLVKTAMSPTQFRQALQPHLHPKDKLMVFTIKTSANWKREE